MCQIVIASLVQLFRALRDNQVDAGREDTRLGVSAFGSLPYLATNRRERGFLCVQVQQERAKHCVAARGFNVRDCAGIFAEIELFTAGDSRALRAIDRNDHLHVSDGILARLAENK